MKRCHRLHLGAGDKYWPGWINHDSEVDLKDLPYKDASVDEIQCIHLFEHLDRMIVDQYLNEWFRVLKPGKALIMEMPSMDKIAQLIIDGEQRVGMTLLGIFGDVRKKEKLMLHQWCWQHHELERVLTTAGFKVNFEEPVFHYKRRDLRVIARKE